MSKSPYTCGGLIEKLDPNHCREVMEQSANQGVPIFIVDDLRTTNDPLTLLLRGIVIKLGITKEGFEANHRKTATQAYMSVNNMNYERNNMRRSMFSPEVTSKFFYKFLTAMSLDIVDMSITVNVQETGEVVTISLNDIKKVIKDNPYHPSIVTSNIDHVE